MDAVEASYTIGDIYAVTLQTWHRSVLRILILIGVLVVVFVALPIVIDGYSLSESIAWFPWNFYLGLTAFLLLFILGACPLIAYFRLKRQGSLGPNRYAFHDDGVRIEGPKAQSVVYWSALNRVTATKSRLFLFITPALAFILPRRAFEDQASFDAAIDEAKARWSAANQ